MHDKIGNPIKKGDRVTIEAEVIDTYAADEFCNVQLCITEKRQEHGRFNVIGIATVNAKQTVLIESS